MRYSEPFGRSKQPDQELRSEQCQTAAEDDSCKLALCAHLAEHESQAADNDRDESERPGQRTGEGALQVPGGALPRRLGEQNLRKQQEDRCKDELCAATPSDD